ncbi:unnamed protein product [Didymodactylos carnosus]|uniref:Uncharacterized protein n=1 Tax=Didymodactylos carnosus TaxID=1234261 RepID=A0A814EYC6_9BILA|nr:unnamed protein product [Didymodactylos carnosus]CAF1266609.1 unnamed protein product [Didymodactylos carnosus]CAF3748521.1 unnamed protein product [Didymodactylos carnosus]CAF4072722.1 unnamed protein product [Didymodactylos carnosus]
MSFVAGSTAEGQFFSSNFQDKVFQDFDVMSCIGEINDENQLIPVLNQPGYVRILANSNNNTDILPVSYLLNDNRPYINGWKIKVELIAKTVQSPFLKIEKFAVDKASIEFITKSSYFLTNAQEFQNALNDFQIYHKNVLLKQDTQNTLNEKYKFMCDYYKRNMSRYIDLLETICDNMPYDKPFIFPYDDDNAGK